MKFAGALLSCLITFPVSMLIAKCIRDAYCDAKKIERSKKMFWTIALCSFAMTLISTLSFVF